MALEPGDDNLKRLYKYRDDSVRTLEFLSSREAFFPFPFQINDPFDCKFPLSFDCTDFEMFQWISQLPLSDDIKTSMFNSYKAGHLDNQEILEWHKKSQSRTAAIYCLSELNDNLLMWSHYSNGHKGICIGLETHIHADSLCIRFDDPLLKGMGALYFEGHMPTFKVDYVQHRPPPHNVYSRSFEDIRPHITSKSDVWCYEKERRTLVLYDQVGTQKLRLHLSSIRDVFFGASITQRFMNDVLEILQKEYWSKGQDVKVYRMDCSDSEYKLETIDLNLK